MYGKWKSTRPEEHKKNTESRKNKSDKFIGQDIERKACDWLKLQGLRQLEQNYLCKYGEIDIVMLDQQQIVFVEVRFRKHNSYGGAVASVDWRKQNKIVKTAAHYLMVNSRRADLACRFDVVAAQANINNTKIDWTWIKDAFIT